VGSIYAYNIASDGALSPITGSPFFTSQSASGATRHEVIEKGEYDLVMGYLEEIARFPTLTDTEAMQLGRDKEAGERAEWYRENWNNSYGTTVPPEALEMLEAVELEAGDLGVW
jgi:hypothetical protein